MYFCRNTLYSDSRSSCFILVALSGLCTQYYRWLSLRRGNIYFWFMFNDVMPINQGDGQFYILLFFCHFVSWCRRVNYIVTWLSVVGPMVRLDVPLSYCTAVAAPSWDLHVSTQHFSWEILKLHPLLGQWGTCRWGQDTHGASPCMSSSIRIRCCWILL